MLNGPTAAFKAARFHIVLVALAGMALSACGGGGNSSSGTTLPSNPSPTPTAAATPFDPTLLQPDDWNTFGHDMQRTGYDNLPNPISGSNANQLQVKWTYSEGSSFVASPIVVNGVVYILGTDSVLTALNASNGQVIWRHALIPQYPTYQSFITPSLYDGKLFVGTHTSTGHLYAIDPTDGNEIWEQTTVGTVRSSPVSINGELYIGLAYGDQPACYPGGIYEYNEATGTPGPSWLTDANADLDGGGVWGPLTYTGSSIIFGTGNTCNDTAIANSVVSTDANMSALWHVQTANGLKDDDVASGILDLNNTGYVSAKNGLLYAIDLSSGNVLWNTALGASDGLGGYATPGYVSGTLFASRGWTYNPQNYGPANAGGALYGLSLQGKIRWSISTKTIVLGQVVGANNVAYAELDNSVDALDPSSGRVLW